MIRMLEEGSECEDALTQLAAVNKGDQPQRLRACRHGPRALSGRRRPRQLDAKKMEKLFHALA